MQSTEIIDINKRPASDGVRPGKVWLVGAGPGDPDLLTMKAVRAIEQADLILYDALVSESIRATFPLKTPALYVGKLKDRHSIPQQRLNELLVEKARQGLNLCRLKGGDAFVFGRGGEEMLELKAANIEVELVPGITAAAGCTSYAGIPLTHRGVSQGCTLVTAHAEKALDINWRSLASLDHTLVFYMGLSKAAMISEELVAAGLRASTPAAFIENGCCPQQRTVRGELGELAELARREAVQSPALIVVGRVVDLADQLSWFSGRASQDVAGNQQIQKLSA
ncbi:uroporphyrinogen-III C-methyltransferase [Pseudomaricurvus alcaniphilus]|uniref:uroporphyrinogen-III C-methyltransferase n=1 Tax=Pseudomaricurvus alcaniphilus TaxID=1166482 RepID=UPI00140B4F13|nr:uroporphyrinogen-III C-methyltransferase [Pseudomaricurvus alcaniphilus]NHN37684.1 uroporphyrinogen-III C-methyltransferase [Pseudomaricurvus alcaniphilus]